MPDLIPLPDVGEHPLHQFRFLLEEVSQGRRCALVTITGVVETASRNAGSHMVVSEDGRYAGSVSSGCVDANVANSALEALQNREPAQLKLGAGSGFIDLALPCGGGLELLITPDPETGEIRQVVDCLETRKPCTLSIGNKRVEFNGPGDGAFVAHYAPGLKLVLAGRGAELTSLCRIAIAGGFEVACYSPDENDMETCAELGACGSLLAGAGTLPELQADPWTAIVLLFHDHDLEAAVLAAALASEAFYIGALGSRKTQAARLEMLRNNGFSEKDLQRIKGPIGLVPAMRNAPMLAISALAEVIECFRPGPVPDH